MNLIIAVISIFFITIVPSAHSSSFIEDNPSSSISPPDSQLTLLEHALKNFLTSPKHAQASLKQKNVISFYKNRNYQPVWVQNSQLSPAAHHILQALKNVEEEGLDSSHFQSVFTIISNFEKTPSLPHQIQVELALSLAALTYLEDLGGERLNPKKIDRRLFINPDPVDEVDLLSQGMANDPSGEWIQTFSLKHEAYQKLKKTLKVYKEIESKGGWPLIPEGPALKEGQKDGRLKMLRENLKMRRDLSLDSENDSLTYDQALVEAIKRFQKRHMLQADGVLGASTLLALNVSVQERIQQIKITMERWRWLPKNLGNRHVLVNIAALTLKAFENEKEVLEMPVIVGQRYRQTPVFSSTIYSIRFNPTWNVPRMIAVQDKLKLIKKDSTYLRKKGFIVYDESGEVVQPESVNWSSLSKGYFPYHLKQLPGSQNALGKIRFSIHSPFDIYLHSTAEPKLFEKSERYLSSGCIRVKFPVELAAFVFNDTANWPNEKISSMMEGTKTMNVTLPYPVPVYITYFTVWQDPQGEIYFAKDIYDQDKRIGVALDDMKRKRFFDLFV